MRCRRAHMTDLYIAAGEFVRAQTKSYYGDNVRGTGRRVAKFGS